MSGTPSLVFLSLVLSGPRSEVHSIPVEVLPELATYRDLVVEVAMEIYRRKHPNAEHVPGDFAEHFQLRLHQSESGSAVCRLERVPPPSSQLLARAEQDEFDEARELIGELMHHLIGEQCVRSIEKRIEELQSLPAGWLDGKGTALPVAGLRWLQEVLVALMGAGLPMPSLYPTLEGGILAEWSLGAWEVSAEIELESRSASVHAAHTEKDEVREVWCELGTQAGRDTLLDFVLGCLPVSSGQAAGTADVSGLLGPFVRLLEAD